MKRRMYYTSRAGCSPIKHVLIVHPDSQGDVTLYCPPGVAGGPWTESFASIDQAMDLASNLAKELGQVEVKRTSDQIDWRLNGLELIGDADEKYRQENS